MRRVHVYYDGAKSVGGGCANESVYVITRA